MKQVLNLMVYFVDVLHGLVLFKYTSNKGEDAAREWLRTTGFKNIDDLNKVLKDTATSWKQRK